MLKFQEEPITELPKTLKFTRQMLEVSGTYLLTLEGMNEKPALFDKPIIDRIFKICNDLKIVTGVFSLFCQNWKHLTLTQEQQSRLDEVENGLSELERLNDQIKFLIDHVSEKYKELDS